MLLETKFSFFFVKGAKAVNESFLIFGASTALTTIL
jgi:hypothetical protein